MIRLSLLYFLIFGFSALCFADATPVENKLIEIEEIETKLEYISDKSEIATKAYVESLSADNSSSGPNSNLLECQPKNAKNAKKTIKTQAGVCPDCDQLKNSPFKELLAVQEFINPLNVKVTAQDNANVEKFVEQSLNPFGVETKEEVESKIAIEKNIFEVYEMCATGKFNPKGQDGYSKTLKKIKPSCLAGHIAKTLKESKSIEIFKSYDLQVAPSTEQLRAGCDVIYAEHNHHVESVDASTDWFNAELQKQNKKLENLTLKLNKFSEKKTPEVKVDLPERAVTAGAGKCGMTLEEYALISSYTGSFYGTLNSALRGQDDSGYISSEQAASIVRIMNSGLAKIRAYEGIAYRATGGLPSVVLAKHKLGNIIQFSSYLSSSTDKRIAEYFGGDVQYVIKSKTGRYINPISAHRGEDEVLFAPMTRFKITNVKKDGKGTIYEMVEQ